MDTFQYTLDLVAVNIQYLLKYKLNEFHESLTINLIEEVVERALKFYRNDIHFDNSPIFECLMKVRNCSSIFELLEQEKHLI